MHVDDAEISECASRLPPCCKNYDFWLKTGLTIVVDIINIFPWKVGIRTSGLDGFMIRASEAIRRQSCCTKLQLPYARPTPEGG